MKYATAVPMGPVVASLYGHGGELLTTVTSEVKTPSTQVTFTVPAAFHVLSGDRLFERRRLDTTVYLVYPDFPYHVTEQEVRDYIGVYDNELPDEAIDLDKAFLLLMQDLGPDRMAQLLTGTSWDELNLNEALMLRAVLDIGPSLILRVAQMEADGVLQHRRMQIDNLDALLEGAKLRYRQLLGSLADPLVTTSYGSPLLTVVRGFDPVTGT